MGVLEIFDDCPGDIWWVSWRYLMVILMIFDGCPGDIDGVREIFNVCPGDN